jgi:hypothetical protein
MYFPSRGDICSIHLHAMSICTSEMAPAEPPDDELPVGLAVSSRRLGADHLGRVHFAGTRKRMVAGAMALPRSLG